MVNENKEENKKLLIKSQMNTRIGLLIRSTNYRSKNGLTTSEKVKTNLRIKWFNQFNFKK